MKIEIFGVDRRGLRIESFDSGVHDAGPKGGVAARAALFEAVHRVECVTGQPRQGGAGPYSWSQIDSDRRAGTGVERRQMRNVKTRDRLGPVRRLDWEKDEIGRMWDPWRGRWTSQSRFS